MVSVRSRAVLTACLLVVGVIILSASAIQAAPKPDKAKLNELATYHARQLEAHRGAPFRALLRSQSPAQVALNKSPEIKLMYVDDRGRPVYYGLDNLTAAATVSTNKVWPDGGYGFSLTGSGTVAGDLGIWDGGSVRPTHQEVTGRVTQVDSPAGQSDHATHVAGTMIASGVVAAAKGMSYQANLTCYDYDNDNSEMATAAAGGMKASNHSYTTIVGWYYHSSGEWYWFGNTDISETEDYHFGFYDSEAQAWDQIATEAPHYTIVGSAGNNRNDTGPGEGG
ncbi:MAG: peptidase S8, partial [Candidatus Eisenbacteria bacterium]|nr:peptidase S8 [Candidatus Eisenbacteria bacterium]